MKFAKLTNTAGAPIYMISTHFVISSPAKGQFLPGKNACAVIYTDGMLHAVKETPEEAVKIIEEAMCESPHSIQTKVV